MDVRWAIRGMSWGRVLRRANELAWLPDSVTRMHAL